MVDARLGLASPQSGNKNDLEMGLIIRNCSQCQCEIINVIFLC